MLERAYPSLIERIRALVEPGFMERSTMDRAPAALSAAFLWHETDEGYEFWRDIYEGRRPRQSNPQT